MVQQTVRRVHGPGEGENVSITFEQENLCGNGRFSNVYAARLIAPTQMKVAIKNAWEDKTKPPLQGELPEVLALTTLNHPNIARLLYYFTRIIDNNKVHCLILDFLPMDISRLRHKGFRFDSLDAKLYSYQLFSAVAYISSQDVIHLDIKPSNLIVDHTSGILKLADFGNAQMYRMDKLYESPYQVTRYYRAPELLFGSNKFSPGIDLWSAACCMFEFIANHVMLKGSNTGEQVRLVVDVFGYPSEDDIKQMCVRRPRTTRKKGRGVDKLVRSEVPLEAAEILEQILVYTPTKRKSAEECLKMSYFNELKVRPPPLRSNGVEIPSIVSGISSEPKAPTKKIEDNENEESSDSE